MENNIDMSETYQDTIYINDIKTGNFIDYKIVIEDNEGETLLSIDREGNVEGYLENISEAAEIFVREIRYRLSIK